MIFPATQDIDFKIINKNTNGLHVINQIDLITQRRQSNPYYPTY